MYETNDNTIMHHINLQEACEPCTIKVHLIFYCFIININFGQLWLVCCPPTPNCYQTNRKTGEIGLIFIKRDFLTLLHTCDRIYKLIEWVHIALLLHPYQSFCIILIKMYTLHFKCINKICLNQYA